ncbi:hypothetical protein GB931_02680 [Modestobacter sp. I12A-02628]|uniref:Uncharacterized protein n=1 Tax=Goekera deserti TaxID=2497753 RepID=A0A7K3WD56_9ACTN|nr:hypothetical protein [Goekera deserti]MPQ96842.1 hypothetical protein [Goekera deserti]NDI46844.1 hypothetical protein [Goekera deserti]NEL54412.1 hypothetical protein [Goekera deserti]
MAPTTTPPGTPPGTPPAATPPDTTPPDTTPPGTTRPRGPRPGRTRPGAARTGTATDRTSPQQVLLGVGAVLVVAVGAATLLTGGSQVGRAAVGGLALVSAGLSVPAATRGLRVAEEALAAVGAVLALLVALDLGPDSPVPGLPASTLAAGGLAVLFASLAGRAEGPLTWPVASWAAVQVGVLGWLTGVPSPAPWPQVALVGTAVTGLLAAAYRGTRGRVAATPVGAQARAHAGARRRTRVALVVLVTALPWWAAGVLSALDAAWGPAGAGAARSTAVALLVTAGAALVLVEHHRELHPYLGNRWLLPLAGGSVAALGVAGAAHGEGTDAVQLAGHAGLLLAVLVSAAAQRGIGVWEPAGTVAAVTLTGTALVQLLLAERWAAVSLLLLACALIAAVVAALPRVDHTDAVTVALACLAAGVGLQAAAGTVPAPWASAAVLVVAVTALDGAGVLRGGPDERPLLRVGAGAALAGLLVVTTLGAWGWLAAELAVWGVALLVYGALPGTTPGPDRVPRVARRRGLPGRRALAAAQDRQDAEDPVADAAAVADPQAERADVGERSGARRLGVVALVAGCWTGAATVGIGVVEVYSLSAAAALLAGSGRQLVTGPSWRTWGPACLVAAVPSVLLGLAEPDALRTSLVLLVATATVGASIGWQVRAPLLVAAGTLLAVAAGLLVVGLPWPLLLGVGGAGVLLLGLGTSYEEERRQRVRGVVGRLAQFR